MSKVNPFGKKNREENLKSAASSLDYFTSEGYEGVHVVRLHKVTAFVAPSGSKNEGAIMEQLVFQIKETLRAAPMNGGSEGQEVQILLSHANTYHTEGPQSLMAYGSALRGHRFADLNKNMGSFDFSGQLFSYDNDHEQNTWTYEGGRFKCAETGEECIESGDELIVEVIRNESKGKVYFNANPHPMMMKSRFVRPVGQAVTVVQEEEEAFIIPSEPAVKAKPARKK